jgi:hypothetical protein
LATGKVAMVAAPSILPRNFLRALVSVEFI